MRNVITALVGILSLVPPAWSLGKDGHEAVCYVAYGQVSPETRRKIDTLLASDPEYGQIEDPAEAFARSCNWADEVKPLRWEEHFVNVPRDTKKIKSLDCPEADKCLLSAIVSDLAVLGDPEANSEDKLKALKYMGHWIGDLHQPLHVSFKSDKGGNDIGIEYWGVSGEPRCNNLHALWDTCLIEAMIISKKVDGAQGLAQYLMAASSKDDFLEHHRKKARYKKPKSVLKWANQSYRVTMDRMTGYCTMSGGSCQRSFSMEVSHLYFSDRMPHLAELLLMGGASMASLLDKELTLSQ